MCTRSRKNNRKCSYWTVFPLYLLIEIESLYRNSEDKREREKLDGLKIKTPPVSCNEREKDGTEKQNTTRRQIQITKQDL